MENPTCFMVTGSFTKINGTPLYDAAGNVCGYKLTNGDIVRLVVALEVERDGGQRYDYVTSEAEISDLGFNDMDYEWCNFVNSLQNPQV